MTDTVTAPCQDCRRAVSCTGEPWYAVGGGTVNLAQRGVLLAEVAWVYLQVSRLACQYSGKGGSAIGRSVDSVYGS